MDCYKHPERKAVAKCGICGQAICDECNVEIGGSNYCKDCVNSLINKDNTPSEENSVKNENTQNLEEIDPILEPKTVPYNEEDSEELNPDEIYEETPVNYETKELNENSPANPSEPIIPEVNKALENYEPEYEYETAYVETYGDGDYEEDYYYENPEQIPEPQPEYQKRNIAEPIFTEQARTGEIYENNEENLELKYERYLEDLYYNEPENSYNYEDQYYVEEPAYESSNNYTNEQSYPEDYRENDPNFIVPAHQRGIEREGPSYDEIKRQIEAQNNINNRKNNRKSKNKKQYEDFDDYNKSYNQLQDLEDIKRMHYEDYEDSKKNNKFTTTEIILTVILIILIIIVVFYLVYLFSLKGVYPTFMDAFYGLIYNPGAFFNNLIH